MSRNPPQGAEGDADRTSRALSQSNQQGVDLSGNIVHTAETRIAQAQAQWKTLMAEGGRVATCPFDRLRRPVLSKVNERASEPWGDQIAEKLPNITRVYFINLNRMTLDSRGGKFDTVCRCVKEVQADIFCG